MMSDLQRASTSRQDQNHEEEEEEEELDEAHIRDIHALITPTPPRLPPLPSPPGYRPRPGGGEAWDATSHRSLTPSVSSTVDSENFTTLSREFNALVLAGTNHGGAADESDQVPMNTNNNNLGRIGEVEESDGFETNPLAIVPDMSDPVASPPRAATHAGGSMITTTSSHTAEVSSVQRVKKEEVEAKITAWQNAKVAKINNRFKREDAIINGWESEQVHKSNSRMKKVERKLEEKRARAMEKMQNDIAKARRKAEERRATAEAKRGTSVTRILEVANLMRAVGRAPVKRSFF